MEKAAVYIRPLAMNRRGAALLKQSKKKRKGKTVYIDNINKACRSFPEIENTLKKDIYAADIYNIITGEDMYEMSDFVKKPVIIDI